MMKWIKTFWMRFIGWPYGLEDAATLARWEEVCRLTEKTLTVEVPLDDSPEGRDNRAWGWGSSQDEIQDMESHEQRSERRKQERADRRYSNLFKLPMPLGMRDLTERDFWQNGDEVFINPAIGRRGWERVGGSTMNWTEGNQIPCHMVAKGFLRGSIKRKKAPLDPERMGS